MRLSEETKQAILELQKQYPVKRSALIPALHIAQHEVGYLPHEIQQEVANLFDVELSEVHSIVTFYDMFYEKPVGKHIVHVCKNLSCMLRGADGVLSKVCKKLHVSPGGTSQDGQYTVIASECLGACDKAPMMLVDEHEFGPVTEDEVDAILENAQTGAGHPRPMLVAEVQHG